MEFVVLLLSGLTIGSFLNVLVFRLNNSSGLKWWGGRSLCPKCKKTIAWYDNIPLLSFVLLGGRCRSCHGKIGWQYPVVEGVSAVVTMGLWLMLAGHSPTFKLLYLFLAYALIVIFFSDLIYGLIPDEMIVVGSLLAGTANFKFQISNFWEDLLTGILSMLAFYLVVLITRYKGMGLGDVKLAFLIGFILGYPLALVAFWSAFVFGGLVAILLLLLKRRTLSGTMALGPFLVTGIMVSALWGKALWHLVIP